MISGSKISESLPNITGQIGFCGETDYVKEQGAVYKISRAAATFAFNTQSSMGRCVYVIDGSRVSSAYKNNASVNPNSIKCSFYMKF